MITERETELTLAMTCAGWATIVHGLAEDASLVAYGELRKAGTGIRSKWVVESPKMTAVVPTGESFAPLASWFVIGMPTGNAPVTPAEWLVQLKPRYAQLCVVLLVGFSGDRSGWCGWSCQRGVVQRLGGFQVAGPRMLNVMRQADGSIDVSQPERWTRTENAVGGSAYPRLRAASVTLVGCSRSGTLAGTMLAALGIRQLTLVDGDDIELHNLDGMVLATPQDLGQKKAVVLGRRLVEFRPDLAVTVWPRSLGSTYDEPGIGDADLIVTCVDQDGPRLRAARVARQRLIPHLDIGTGITATADGEREMAADVRLLFPGEGCVSCVGGLQNVERAEHENWAPPGSLSRYPPDPWNRGGRLGSLISLNSMAVSTGIQSWLDLLAGRLSGSIWHRIRWEIGGTWRIDSGLVAASDDCTICRGLRRRGRARERP